GVVGATDQSRDADAGFLQRIPNERAKRVFPDTPNEPHVQTQAACVCCENGGGASERERQALRDTLLSQRRGIVQSLEDEVRVQLTNDYEVWPQSSSTLRCAAGVAHVIHSR